MKTASVYTKEDGKLVFLPSLIKDEFGDIFDSKFGLWAGKCMITQVMSILEAYNVLPRHTMLNQIHEQLDPYFDYEGVTLKAVLDALQPLHSHQIGAIKHKSFTSALKAMIKGHPILAVYNSAVYGFEANESDGMLQDDDYFIRQWRGALSYTDPTYHSLILIGIDRAHEQAIFMDTRSVYNFRGYLKVPLRYLVRGILRDKFHYIQLVVE